MHPSIAAEKGWLRRVLDRLYPPAPPASALPRRYSAADISNGLLPRADVIARFAPVFAGRLREAADNNVGC